MDEIQLIEAWRHSRWHIILAQLGPTFLLAVSLILFVSGLGSATLAVRLAAAGILLASGMLGAVAQISSADEGLAIVADLAALPAETALGRRIASSALWMIVVKFVTPTIFVLIYLAELWALFIR